MCKNLTFFVYQFQLKMVPLGIDNLNIIDEPTRRKVFEQGQRGGGGVDSKSEGGPDGSKSKGVKTWGVGEMEFEALMRMLDNAVSFTIQFYFLNYIFGKSACELTKNIYFVT